MTEIPDSSSEAVAASVAENPTVRVSRAVTETAGLLLDVSPAPYYDPFTDRRLVPDNRPNAGTWEMVCGDFDSGTRDEGF